LVSRLRYGRGRMGWRGADGGPGRLQLACALARVVVPCDTAHCRSSPAHHWPSPRLVAEMQLRLMKRRDDMPRQPRQRPATEPRSGEWAQWLSAAMQDPPTTVKDLVDAA